MAVFKFRVIFEDDTDCVRDIEIKGTQTFEELHLAVLKSVNFQPTELASFYAADDNWRKGQEISLMDMTDQGEDFVMINESANDAPLVMSKCTIQDFIDDPHQKFIYVFDFLNMWTFNLELIKIIPKEEPKVAYPRCVKSEGQAPKQFKNNNLTPSEDDEEEGGKKKNARGAFADMGGVEEYEDGLEGEEDEFGEGQSEESEFDEFSSGEFGEDDRY